jgi:hypothetical protein
MAMTWAQVRGLNYGTMGRNLRADMWSDGVPVGRLWFVPPTSWRIEDAAGDVNYIENDIDEYRRAEDGAMVHSAKSPSRWVMVTNDSPSHLATAYSQWPLDDQGMPPRLTQAGEPQPTEVLGRQAWEVRFTHAASGGQVSYAIDAELGVALSCSQGSSVVELSDPVLDEEVDRTLLTWSGPTREEADQSVSPAQREYEAKMAALGQMPQPRVTWLPLTIVAQPQDGDPRTGALDLQVNGQAGYFTLRQWITEIGEPEILSTFTQPQVRHREAVGPWTYEIRSYNALEPDDCARIIASIVPATPPSAAPEQIREALDRDARDAADAELDESLGTGRRLADYLGGNGDVSLLIRTDFTDDAAWRTVAAAAMAPGVGDESDFAAILTCVNTPENDGLSIADLLEMIGDRPPYYVFIADATTMADPEHPILAVDTGAEEFGHSRGQTVRVIPCQMWSIENNLSISNMDFEDFVDGAGPDGVYRGFE